MKSLHSRFTVVGLFATLVLLAGLLALPNPRAAAQSDPPAGVTIETLSSLHIPVDREKTLQELRITFRPGTSMVLHDNPGPVIVSVVSGELTASVASWNVLLTRNGSTASYSVEPGKRYTLEPGDKTTFEFTETADVLQNQGTAPLVLVASVLSQDGQSPFAIEQPTPAPHLITVCRACR